MLREMLVHERQAVDTYRKLLAQAEGRNVSLEEFARQMIRTEELDVAEIEKMLRPPGRCSSCGSSRTRGRGPRSVGGDRATVSNQRR